MNCLNHAAIITEEKDDEDMTNTGKVQKFIKCFNETNAKNLVLQEKYNSKVRQVEELTKEKEEIINELETEYLPTITDLEGKLKSYVEQITKLQRTVSLREKEIQYLRDSLKKMEEISKVKRTEGAPLEEDKSLLEYMSNLEKLVDEYKTRISEFEKKQAELKSIETSGVKRQRRESNNSFQNQALELEKQNLDLSTKLKQAQTNVDNLKYKVAQLEQIHGKQEEYKVLQLKNSLISQDQLIKQSTLTALRKENEELITKYVKGLDPENLIPRSIFERQEDDKAKLQLQIDTLNKRINRLREVFTKKSKDIITIIAKYFGFIIEFLPNPINPSDLFSRIKLKSKYIPKDEDCYLIIDTDSRSLKAHGNYKFKSICEELAKFWVEENNQFPCLLSAVNLKVYETYAKQ
ncbi:LOW QUALITY PROTEIN: MAD1 Spindle assembly checkpoint component MAD1 [Candida maltosa Xu316]